MSEYRQWMIELGNMWLVLGYWCLLLYLLQSFLQTKQIPSVPQGEIHSVRISLRRSGWIYFSPFPSISNKDSPLCVPQCTILFGVHPPRTCSSLKNYFSAPNHSTDMKFVVYDPNTSKNKWKFVNVFSLLKIGRKSIKT